MQQVPRVAHIAITVTDLDRSVAWYGSGLALRDPDDIALEFFSPPPKKS